MKKLTVLDDYQGVVSRLAARRILDGSGIDLEVLNEGICDEQKLIAALAETDCLVLIRERTRVTAAVIAALPRLKLIVQTGRLSGAIDLEACARHGVAVREGSGNPIAPAELTWALILAASRRIVPYARQLEQGRWQRSAPALADERLGRALGGRTLGIWGFGKIGKRVGAVGRALGMKVLVHGRDQSRAAAEAEGLAYVADRLAFLGQVDVLTLHLRLCAETRHLIGDAELAALRPDALLVNTSRAELLAPGALLRALGLGRPGMAALDVFDDEPEGAAAYLGHPNILCTPHLGFVEQDTYEAYFGEAFTHVRNFLAEAAPPGGPD
ncbi:MAG: D-2-hydroxyacid dehydrogenase family protein [Dechloromonas sp.]|nr:D-2-hydroxyacid dehydrogenase family protein [Dechloromonas sp.]